MSEQGAPTTAAVTESTGGSAPSTVLGNVTAPVVPIAAAPATTTALGEKTWRDSLPEEIRKDPSISTFDSVENLVKSYISTKSMVGKKGVVVPGDKATDEEMKSFYKSIGQPELDQFAISAPKDMAIDEKVFGQAKEVFHKLGLLPKQAQEVVNWWGQVQASTAKEMKAQQANAAKEQLDGLKKEWGAGYDKQIALAKLGVKDVGGDEFQAYLEKTGLGNDPTLIKVMSKVGALLGEDKLRGDGAGKFGSTPAELDKEIQSIRDNPKHPFFDSSHPGHMNAVRQMESLYKMRYQDQSA